MKQRPFFADDKLVTFLYMYLIMILQLIANISLFVCTSYQIRKLQRETAQITNKGDSRKFNRMEADKDRFVGQLMWVPIATNCPHFGL